MDYENLPECLRKFFWAYVACALWSTNDESTPQGGEPMDKNYDMDDLDPVCKADMLADCQAFMMVNAHDLEDSDIDLDRAGHCFWLNRNGHGSGFWDEDTIENLYRKKLDHASKAYGEVNLYVGDDGKIYS